MAVGTQIGQQVTPIGGTQIVIGIGGKPTDTLIANLALGHVGSSVTIANMLTEKSTEALNCRRFFDLARQSALEDYPWPEATGYATLALVALNPNTDWAFAYRYPTDCVFVRRILTSAGRLETEPPAFRIGRDAQGKLIFTNWPNAVVEFTFDVVEASEFSASLVEAISWKLAELIAPATSRIKDMAAQCRAVYEREAQGARSNAANEGQTDPEADADTIRARA
jgi:hypothetical protein